MNLHGYKLKSKNITRLLKIEEAKKEPCHEKILRLQKSKRNIIAKIQTLRKPIKTFDNKNRKGR